MLQFLVTIPCYNSMLQFHAYLPLHLKTPPFSLKILRFRTTVVSILYAVLRNVVKDDLRVDT